MFLTFNPDDGGDLAQLSLRSYVEVHVCRLGPWLAQPPGLSLTGRCPMPTTTPSAALVPTVPVFTNAERLALAGFLAGYSGLTLHRGVSSFLVRAGPAIAQVNDCGSPQPTRQAGPSRLGRPAVLAGPVAVAVRVHRRRPGPPSGSPPRPPPHFDLRRAQTSTTSTRRALKPPGLEGAGFPELSVAALCATLALQGGNRDRARRPSPDS